MPQRGDYGPVCELANLIRIQVAVLGVELGGVVLVPWLGVKTGLHGLTCVVGGDPAIVFVVEAMACLAHVEIKPGLHMQPVRRTLSARGMKGDKMAAAVAGAQASGQRRRMARWPSLSTGRSPPRIQTIGLCRYLLPRNSP